MKKLQKISLNDKIVYVHHTIQKGDIIQCDLEYEEDNSNIVPTPLPLSILYEDEGYLVINKPAGIPVHPSCDHYTDSLSNRVRFYFDQIRLKKKIRPVNRLDKDTSGLVIFAKNEYIQENMVQQMKNHCFKKEYIAIVEGILEKKTSTIHLPIARKLGSIIERAVCFDGHGEEAITHYEVLKEISNTQSVVKVLLQTGRTHQIRVHFSYMGHPIIGDTLYGNESVYIKRQALHAYKVSFFHPITKQTLTIVCPLPSDMQKLIL